MGEDEIRGLAQEIIRQVEATGPQDMGQIMKALMPKVSGRADGKLVSQIVLSLLSND
jgi:uncharacterized protein YqeY